MSLLRFDNRRSTSLLPTGRTRRRSLVRNAVTATDMASFGSFLFDLPVPSTRVRAANVAGTSTTISPAVTSCWASRNPSPSAPSIAHVRDVNGAAHDNNVSTWARLSSRRFRAVRWHGPAVRRFPSGKVRDMARTLDLAPWAGRWVAVDAADRVRSDASSLAELLRAIEEADLGEVEVMRAPAPDEPVVYGLG